jgi:hypothetical protein
MPYKFILGQAVEFYAPRALHAPPWSLRVDREITRVVNLNITSNIPVNFTNALRGKANFVWPADDAGQYARNK